MRYADIIVDISHEKLDKVFQYAIPRNLSGMATVGSRVIIPFGNGNRQIKGYIVGLSDEPSFDPARIKEIIAIDTLQVKLDSRAIKLAHYMRKHYGATINDALKTVIPVKKVIKNKEKRYIRVLKDEQTIKDEMLKYKDSKKFQARYRALSAFENVKIVSEEFLIHKLNVTKTVITSLVNLGLLEVIKEVEYRDPIKVSESADTSFELNTTQKKAVDTIVGDYRSGERKTYLIHGVTGSGKTLVYMEIISEVLKSGKKIIMLIPEIALTYQTVKRFYSRFGNRISIMNSRLSDGERYDQYLKAKNGDIDIIIGPRSALFTPFENIGLIVIDEEHEGSYKSEMPPKYDARQVANYLAKLEGASVILGSATPSLDSYYRAQKGEYTLVEMNERAGNAVMPKVYIEDLRQEMKEGNMTIFSRRLNMLINDRLSKGEQIMLFINRRGYSGFVSCRSCGHILKCPHCDVSLTYHNVEGDIHESQKYVGSGVLKCHYCGYEQHASDKCPECSSKFISVFGTGTQKVERMAQKMYPNAKILRMDADTTKSKNGHEDILSAFANGQADILIGTQMIVKGHDFPNVTLVGILAADLSLGNNDYNASEYTFDLLLQAAGRAGRADKSGEVVIQTYRPEHYSVTCAANCDYTEFYRNEILYRSLGQYPPVKNMLAILIMCKNEDKAIKCSEVLKQLGERFLKEKKCILGPTPATVSKINDIYRRVMYIKHGDKEMLIKIRNEMQEYVLNESEYKDCTVHFDINQ